jgi:hypothetical protein
VLANNNQTKPGLTNLAKENYNSSDFDKRKLSVLSELTVVSELANYDVDF